MTIKSYIVNRIKQNRAKNKTNKKYYICRI